MNAKPADKSAASSASGEPAGPTGDLSIRTLAMPADTNQNGDIFGGWLLSQMDVAGGIYASKATKSRAVTVAIEAMNFRKPVYIGDLVSVYAETVRVGRTSITVRLEAWVTRRAEMEASSSRLQRLFSCTTHCGALRIPRPAEYLAFQREEFRLRGEEAISRPVPHHDARRPGSDLDDVSVRHSRRACLLVPPVNRDDVKAFHGHLRNLPPR